MDKQYQELEYYPDQKEIEAWIEDIWQTGQEIVFDAELLPEHDFGPTVGVRHLRGQRYVRFSPQGMDPFYGYWQPAHSASAPLLIHVPGYGAEISCHPDLVMQGYNVLHINPLGYVTPKGRDESKRKNDTWPVYTDTFTSGAKKGYRQWLINCVLAIKWAQSQPQVLPNRISFFGTSQGGGTSLILGSIYQGRGVRCVAADVPWLINFPLYKVVHPEWWTERMDTMPAPMWHAMGFIDVLSHAPRLTVPVMLVAGEQDNTCPPATIASLFKKLPATRMYCTLQDQGHAYTQPFIMLAAAWFRLYA